jgi:16S rRNA (cytosine1407-C5)-methyltransferase
MSRSSLPRGFRLVCRPEQRALVEELLREQGFAFEAEAFFSSARRLTEEPFPLGASLAAAFGRIYIQDRSSMLPPLALDPPEGGTAFDLCASPGGKTSLLAELVGERGFTLGNEPNPARLATLRRNLARLNLPQAATCSFPGENMPLPDGFCRHILLDPPCSGWGTEEKHPKVRSLWVDEKTRPLIRLQRLLLREAARLLAPGGRLVYSTCTTNPEENEAQIRFAAETLGLKILPLAPFRGFVFDAPEQGAGGCLRVNGEASGAQGFFVALLTKDAAVSLSRTPPLPPVREESFPDIPREALRFLPPGVLRLTGDTVRFLPRAGAEFPPGVCLGFALGTRRGGRLRLFPHVGLPPAPEAGSLNIEEISLLQDLLAGRALPTGLPGKESVLYWRGLPLARLRLKNGRALL